MQGGIDETGAMQIKDFLELGRQRGSHAAALSDTLLVGLRHTNTESLIAQGGYVEPQVGSVSHGQAPSRAESASLTQFHSESLFGFCQSPRPTGR